MAIERLKFRCYRCNQLLAVSPNRAGTVVSCPKCQADLLIPSAEPSHRETRSVAGFRELRVKPGSEERRKGESEARAGGEAEGQKVRDESTASAEAPWEAMPSESPPKPGSVIGLPDELAAMIPPDLVDLRPEDLRVEAEFFESLTRSGPGLPSNRRRGLRPSRPLPRSPMKSSFPSPLPLSAKPRPPPEQPR